MENNLLEKILLEQQEQTKILRNIVSNSEDQNEKKLNDSSINSEYHSTKLSDLVLEYGSIFILGLIAGGTLSQLGTELWKLLIA